jgi:hypothetical protein
MQVEIRTTPVVGDEHVERFLALDAVLGDVIAALGPVDSHAINVIRDCITIHVFMRLCTVFRHALYTLLKRVGYRLATNLKCLCRLHHLLKTFWGWRDQQLPDGHVIWKLPDGHTYITTPRSALLFPTLCAPTGELPEVGSADAGRCGIRTAMMPLRVTTRAANRVNRIAAERHQNQQIRERTFTQWQGEEIRVTANDEPPPF